MPLFLFWMDPIKTIKTTLLKKATPRSVAFYASLFSAVLLTLIFGLYNYLTDESVEFLLLTISFALSQVIVYVVVYYGVENFVHNKVKLVYKTIHRLKIQEGPKIKPVSMNADMFEEVNKDVEVWADERKQEILALKQQEEFRREFIGNLAHELKTPIFNIQGYILSLLEGGLEDETINRTYLERTEYNIDRLLTLVRDLDVITKLESDKQLLKIEKFNLIEVFDDVIKSLEMKAKEKNIALKLAAPKDKPFFVLADKSKINQIITNLTSNSIYYGNESGSTTFKVYDMDENYLIEVSDNGMGIAEEHLPRLFERFYRVDKSRARHKGGSGLGLAIVKHIIDAHNQTINVRSVVDKGTTFSFTLKKAKR